MINKLNFAFPIVLNSGAILSVSGILIGMMVSDASIAEKRSESRVSRQSEASYG